MDKNLDIVAEELFGKIRTQFPKIKLGDENSESTDEPEKARFFKFDYVVDGASLGNVDVSLSEEDGLVIIYSNDIIEGQDEFTKNRFFRFLREMREFAKQRFLNFDTRDIAKSNLEKRDYEHMSKKHGEGNMSESKLYGTSKTSYQQLENAKLIVKHSAPVNFENPAGRAQRIESIYIENAQGERFKYPFKHLNGARALAQHVGHGGTPYDTIGEHVIGLSEELSKLRMFKSYVDRNPVVSEAMGSVHSKVMERIDAVKKEIHQLQSPARYAEFAESFKKAESKEIPEDIMNDWVDRLTIRTFNEELKNVFPYIFKLVDESDIPVKELTTEDLLGEGGKPVNPDAPCIRCKTPYGRHFRFDPEGDPNGKITSTMIRGLCGRVPDDFPDLYKPSVQETLGTIKEFDNYEKTLESIVNERTDIFSDKDDSKMAAIEKLNQLIAQPLPVGTDGSNAIESLTDVIDDDELSDVFKELADINPEEDIRDILKDYITIKDQENGTDVLSQIQFPEPGTDVPPAEPVSAEPAPLATEPAAEAPPAPAPEAPPVMPAAESIGEETLPWETDDEAKERESGKKEKSPFKKAKNPNRTGGDSAKALAQKGMKNALKNAAKAGATAETVIRIGDKEITLGEAIKAAGLQMEDYFDESTGSAKELVEFVKSMYDYTTGNFPKGETGVLIAVEKKFGESAVSHAQKVIGKLRHIHETTHLRKLAGIWQN